MGISDIINEIFPAGLNMDDALDLLADVVIYVLGMAAYAFFVFRFYRFLASPDMFELDLSRYERSRFRFVRSALHALFYVIKDFIFFPFFAFFWLAVLTLILSFLSKGQLFDETLLMALATVSAVRVTAYYRERLSRELAKILPFALLAIFLIDASFFSITDSLESLRAAEDYTEDILYSLAFLVALEFALRILQAVTSFISHWREWSHYDEWVHHEEHDKERDEQQRAERRRKRDEAELEFAGDAEFEDDATADAAAGERTIGEPEQLQ